MKALAPAALLLLTTGCASTALVGMTEKFTSAGHADGSVSEIVCVWQPAEGKGLDGLPTRGFAGQILFLSSGKPTPVAVDGDVRVYVFDDQGTVEQQAKPIHQFDFQGEVWKAFQREGTLGTSYHVFIPYTRKGSHQAVCSLRVRLAPTAETAVFSDSVRVTLPGKVEETADETDARPVVQTAAHVTGTATDAAMPADAAAALRTFQPLLQARQAAALDPDVHRRGANAPAVELREAERMARVEQMLERLLQERAGSIGEQELSARRFKMRPATEPSVTHESLDLDPGAPVSPEHPLSGTHAVTPRPPATRPPVPTRPPAGAKVRGDVSDRFSHVNSTIGGEPNGTSIPETPAANSLLSPLPNRND